MDKKIRKVWLLAVVSSVLLICLDGHWLYGSISYSISQNERLALEQLDSSINECASKMQSRFVPNDTGYVLTVVCNHGHDTASMISSTASEIKRSTVMMSKNIVTIRDTFFAPEINSTEAHVVLARSLEMIRQPFDSLSMDSIMRARSGDGISVSYAKLPSSAVKSYAIRHAGMFSHSVKACVPYDPLRKNALIVTVPINIHATLTAMVWQIVATVFVTLILLITLASLVGAMLRQRKIDALRQDFVHTMIHELRRPVQTLKMCVSLLRGNEGKESTGMDNESLIETAAEETDNLTEYIGKLRDVISVEEHLPMNIEAFDVHSMLESEARRYGKDCADKTVHVALKYERQSDTMLGDRMQIANAVRNLLENSVKYSGEDVSITIECRDEASSVVISVADNGIGIPEKEQRMIFHKFYRATNTNSLMQPGMGLGLSYVRMVAAAHGGKVALRSKPMAGTAVTLTIPQDTFKDNRQWRRK